MFDFTQAPSPEQIRQVSDWLAQANYKVIRPLEIRSTYCDGPAPEKLITVAVLDTETTGISPARDKVIELGIVFVEICPTTGQAYRITRVFNELEDPGMPIPEESTKVHHITDEMVAGKRIDDAEVESLLASVSLIVAHNAGFDRVFVEQRFPIFASKPWACSFQQIPWAEEGFGSAKLEFLAYQCGFHYTGHRASTDCYALLEVLQQTLPVSNKKAMQVLLENARQPDVRVSALGSPFESKDLLRERGYRWNAEQRVWAKNVPNTRLDEEAAWLKTFVYQGKSFRLEHEKITAKNRFSNRPGPTEVVKYE